MDRVEAAAAENLNAVRSSAPCQGLRCEKIEVPFAARPASLRLRGGRPPLLAAARHKTLTNSPIPATATT